MNGTDRTDTTNALGVHRRRLLAGNAAALLAGGAVSSAATGPAPSSDTPHPDAELLALAEFYFAGQPVIDAWNRGEIAEEEAEPIDARLIEAIERMAEIPAATVGGIHAKARVALHSLGTAGPAAWDFDVRLAQAALQDLVREVLA